MGTDPATWFWTCNKGSCKILSSQYDSREAAQNAENMHNKLKHK